MAGDNLTKQRTKTDYDQSQDSVQQSTDSTVQSGTRKSTSVSGSNSSQVSEQRQFVNKGFTLQFSVRIPTGIPNDPTPC